MATGMLAKVAGPVLSVPSVAKAVPALSSSSVMFGPVSRCSGRAISVRQSGAVRFWQGVQVRAQTTAQKDRVSTGEDIIDKIKHDHRELQESYTNYKSALHKGDDMEARKWFNHFVWEISRHSVSEELVLYPMIATLGDKGEKLADESRADHKKLKQQLADLQKTHDMDSFDKKMNEMMATLKDHIDMEESEDLPYLEQNTEVSDRETAGRTFALGKEIVPTHPHPSVPEKFVALEAAMGLLVKPFDELRNLFTSFPSTDKKSLN